MAVATKSRFTRMDLPSLIESDPPTAQAKPSTAAELF
jgi:hypothetical protein